MLLLKKIDVEQKTFKMEREYKVGGSSIHFFVIFRILMFSATIKSTKMKQHFNGDSGGDDGSCGGGKIKAQLTLNQSDEDVTVFVYQISIVIIMIERFQRRTLETQLIESSLCVCFLYIILSSLRDGAEF
jgi:hypothetical protein